jgi:hypothetical protein
VDPIHLSYLKEKGTVWFNPSYGLVGFWNEHKKILQKTHTTHDSVWRHKDLKRAKEIFVTSIIAKAISKQDLTQWWINKPKADPPDGVIGTIVDINGFKKMSVREVEIVEHFNGKLIDTIRKKLLDKRYEPNTILTCYISQGGIFDLKKESKTLLNKITSLTHIFFVFPGLNIKNIKETKNDNDLLRSVFKYSVVQIKPVYSEIEIDPIEDCKNLLEGNEPAFFIYEGRGKENFKSVVLNNPPKLF